MRTAIAPGDPTARNLCEGLTSKMKTPPQSGGVFESLIATAYGLGAGVAGAAGAGAGCVAGASAGAGAVCITGASAAGGVTGVSAGAGAVCVTAGVVTEAVWLVV